MSDSLQGKQMIVVGGSGGVGWASTEMLAGEGASLVIGYASKQDRAKQFEKFGRIVQADITRAEDRTKLLDAAPDLYGLVVFAGDAARAKTVEEVEQAMRRSMEVNYLGPILLAACLPRKTSIRRTSCSRQGPGCQRLRQHWMHTFPGRRQALLFRGGYETEFMDRSLPIRGRRLGSNHFPVFCYT